MKIEESEEDIDGVKTFVQVAEPVSSSAPTGKVILLLHGAAFSSQTWIDQVDTIASLAALGNK